MTLSHRRFLTELVKTKSFSGSESAAALLCAQRMRELGYKHVKIDEVGNVVGGNYDYTKDPHADLLLYSHLDTVGGFWLVKSDADGIFGRGAVDAKGCLASYIEAGAKAPKELKLVVAGVTEEEAPTSTGAKHLLTYVKPRMAVNGEPSNTSGITLAYKGRILVECRTQGQASHAGSHAENPIEKTFEYYEKLRAHFPQPRAGASGDFSASARASASPTPASTLSLFDSVVFNITHIEYGSKDSLNVIPAALDFFIDVRIPPFRSVDDIVHLFKSSAPANIHVKIGESFAGCELEANHLLARAMVSAVREAGLTPRYLKKSGSADMNLSMAAGIPTLAYGPGDSKLDHTDKEYLLWSDYEKAIEVLTHFLSNPALCPKEEK